MKLAARILAVCFCTSISGLTGTASSPGVNSQPAYRHAYYLFLSGGASGCEECYVPLLVTQESLEEAAKASTKTASVVITTYERDSIWHNDGMASIAPAEVEPAPRILHLRGRKYRYQEISSTEALKLFENPLGTIPISRTMLPALGSPGPMLEDLISSFRKLN